MRNIRQGLLALSIIGLTSTSNVWAQTGLTGIELLSSPIETRVILKSPDTLGARVVSADSERIVLEIGGVDPTKTVPTDFSSAVDIDQVILKPSGRDRLQMIIRGNQLGSPLVMMRRPIRQRPAVHKTPIANVSLEQESDGSKTTAQPQTTAQATEGFAMTSMANESPAVEQPQAVLPGVVPAEAPVSAAAEAEAAVGVPTETESEPIELSSPIVPDRAPIATAPPDEATMEVSENDGPTSWQENAMAWLEWGMNKIDHASQKLPFSKTIAVAICLGLGALLTGGSIALRLRKSKQSGVFDLADPQPRFNWNRIFGALQHKGRRTRSRKRPMAQNSQNAHLNQPARRVNTNERPIGLGRVNMAQPSAVVQQRQALQQYAQHADSPLNTPNLRPKVDLDRELQRSLQMRGIVEQTQSLKPTPQKAKPNHAASQPKPVSKPMQQPQRSNNAAKRSVFTNPEPALPANNNEVLDFLRSVADLMEQDGQTHLAKGIKKGIQSHTQS